MDWLADVVPVARAKEEVRAEEQTMVDLFVGGSFVLSNGSGRWFCFVRALSLIMGLKGAKASVEQMVAAAAAPMASFHGRLNHNNYTCTILPLLCSVCLCVG